MLPAPPPRESAAAPSRGLPIAGKIVSLDPALARAAPGIALAATVLARAGGVTTLATTEGEIALRLATLLRAGQPVRLELPPDPRPTLTALVTPDPTGRTPDPAVERPRETPPPGRQPPQRPGQPPQPAGDAPARPANAAGRRRPPPISLPVNDLAASPQAPKPSDVLAQRTPSVVAGQPAARPPGPFIARSDEVDQTTTRPTAIVPDPKALSVRATAAYAAIDRFAGPLMQPLASEGGTPPARLRAPLAAPMATPPSADKPVDRARPERPVDLGPRPPANPVPQPASIPRAAPPAQPAQPVRPDLTLKPQPASAPLAEAPQAARRAVVAPERPTPRAAAEAAPAPSARAAAPIPTAQTPPRAGDADHSVQARPPEPASDADGPGPRAETPGPGLRPRLTPPTPPTSFTPWLDAQRPILSDPSALTATGRGAAVPSTPMPDSPARPGSPATPPAPTLIVDDAAPRNPETAAAARTPPVAPQPATMAAATAAEQLAAAQRALAPSSPPEPAEAIRGPGQEAPQERATDRPDPQAPIARADLSAPLAEMFELVYEEPPPSHVATAADDALIAEATLSQIGLFRIETREIAGGFALVVRHAEPLSDAAAGAVADSVRAEAEQIGARARVRTVYDPALRPTS